MMNRLSLFQKYVLITVTALVISNLFVAVFSFRTIEDFYLSSFTLYNQKVLSETTENVCSINDQMLRVLNFASENVLLKEYLSKKELPQRRSAYLLSGFMNTWLTLSHVNSELEDITFLGKNGSVLILGTYTSKMPVSAKLEEHPFTKAASENAARVSYLYSDDGFFTGGNAAPVLVAVKPLVNRPSGEQFGTFYAVIPEENISDLYESVCGEQSDVLLINRQNLIVSSNHKEWLGLDASALLNELAGDGEVSFQGKNYLCVANELPTMELHMVNLVDRAGVLAALHDRQPILYGVCALLALLFALLAFSVTTHLNRQLKRLIRHMSHAGNGQLTKIEPVSGEPEIRALQQHYNRMTDEIEQYIARLKEEQDHLRAMEIRTLQAQINPHFLYNTLASIKYLSWQENTAAIGEVVDALTTLLRSTIGAGVGDETVEAELGVLKSYACIAHWRFGDGIGVCFEAEPACLGCRLPRMLLQPFLENAFFHAYQVKKTGLVTIRFAMEEGKLLAEITDDGDGMDEQKCRSLLSEESQEEHFSGIGVHNVRERLALLYGEAGSVEVESALGEGTRIRIRIPEQHIGENAKDVQKRHKK